jgi:Fe-S-cluster-containing dehydrogenase component/anaerobic selenocysteine-containing dehydrogenase
MDKMINDNAPHESRYWKSLRQYFHSADANDAKVHEFMQGVTDDFSPTDMSGISRKQFLALLSASAAFAAAGCTSYRDKGAIVPYNRKPEEITLGKANYYASTCSGCEHACGILIKTREGRPIKIDGNLEHPVNKGKICAKGQASVLNLYDPERLREPQQKFSGMGFGKTTWKTADAATIAALQSAVKHQQEIALVTHTIVSPTTKKAIDDFCAAYPTAKVYSYEVFTDDVRRKAWKRSTGGATFPLIAWEKAKLILSLEADFLGTDGHYIEQTRLYAANRDAANVKTFSRLYAAESGMTLTGMNADRRLRVRPDAQIDLVLSLLNEIIIRRKQSRYANDNALASVLGGYSLEAFAAKSGIPETLLRTLADDLIAHKGEAIVYAGSTLPEDVYTAVNLLNEALENSALYRSEQSRVTHGEYAAREDWESLVAKMNNGTVGAVIHMDANPVFHLAPDYGYADALKKVPFSAALVESQNETSMACTFALPVHHAFESWNDCQTRTGILSLQQPVINSLYDTRQKEAALLVWTTARPDAYTETLYHEYLRARWEKEVYPSLKPAIDFSAFWYASLEAGVVTFDEPSIAFSAASPDVVGGGKSISSPDSFIIMLHDNYYIGDGRFANNGWLQEMTHPASKIVWDNYAAVSPTTAKALNVKNDDLLELTGHGTAVSLPVFVQPGMADRVVAAALGYGRHNAGTVGTGVGVDTQRLLSKAGHLSPWLYADVTVKKGSGTYELVSTQEQHAVDDSAVKDLHYKREIIREGTLADYEEHPGFIREERHKQASITSAVKYEGVKWAMSIDLNKCTGCGVCTVSCNVENNIPIVGKDQVRRGRDMAWIRIDRYFSGTPDDPTVSVQPMLCQHCDNAPCENVCPVVATSHSPDGLNQMAYNRCVGTRYCSNNCPFKVRRFNFYDFRDQFADGIQKEAPVNMMHNPEVTVRSRGVMEKCTFCIQRIMEARQTAIAENRPLKGGDVTTACQQACPAQAIVFGDMNDKDSAIAHAIENELGYGVLEELNVRPNVTYIARLKNV